MATHEHPFPWRQSQGPDQVTARSAITTYLQEVVRKFESGHAREHAYRPAFQNLIEGMDPRTNAINDPRQSDFGAPDFIIKRGDLTVGHVEAKDVGIPLGPLHESEQVVRYRDHTENLILTNYLAFDLFREGVFTATVEVGSVTGGKIKLDDDAIPELADLVEEFLGYGGVSIRSAKTLS
jgi:hypothetical protein